jgi:glucose-6-phosphate dehydrogenase assembly protein OpcA
MSEGVIAGDREYSSSRVPVEELENALADGLHSLQAETGSPVIRAHLSNLIIYCQKPEVAQTLRSEIPEVLNIHPARVLLLVGKPGSQAGPVTGEVSLRTHPDGEGHRVTSEVITLEAAGHAVERLPFAVRSLVIGDLPINLWWAVAEPPALGGSLLFEMVEHVQQIIYDSLGWMEPARGVVATAAWINQAERSSGGTRWRAVSDLNWRRLKSWRRLLAQAMDPASVPAALDTVTQVLVEHGPHAVIQAWELVSWLASRLGWKVHEGRIKAGLEIGWHFTSAKCPVEVCIRRLEQGPSRIQKVRIAWKGHGDPGAMVMTEDQPTRLSALPEKGAAMPRTMTVPPQSLAQLVGRQLSDRERDPIFHQSMSVARILAQSVLTS